MLLSILLSNPIHTKLSRGDTITISESQRFIFASDTVNLNKSFQLIIPPGTEGTTIVQSNDSTSDIPNNTISDVITDRSYLCKLDLDYNSLSIDCMWLNHGPITLQPKTQIIKDGETYTLLKKTKVISKEYKKQKLSFHGFLYRGEPTPAYFTDKSLAVMDSSQTPLKIPGSFSGSVIFESHPCPVNSTVILYIDSTLMLKIKKGVRCKGEKST